MDTKADVLSRLSTIIDPDLGRDIVSLGFIKNLVIDEAIGEVSFTVELTTPACPVKEQFRSDCRERLMSLSWVKTVNVTMTGATKQAGVRSAGPGLAEVKTIVAVSSCKGGVGKSTTAVNLAFAMAGRGGRVGIFDADVYGPSLSTLIKAEFNGLYQKNKLIIPVEHEGLKLMSFAYAGANTGGGPAIMRGPMVTQVINQLLTGTDWGALDYLVIDMPPGTGDTQLTLSQLIPITAAIIVTTPQQLSFIDVEKGIQMFDKLKIPTVAVVENMSYFQCQNCDARHTPFGAGSMRKLVEQYGFTNAFTLPIVEQISRLSDAGVPIVVDDPDAEVSGIYRDLADAVIREVSTIVHGGRTTPTVEYDTEAGDAVFRSASATIRIPGRELRLHCRCARCINELTGDRILRDDDVPVTVHPEQINPMGNYAVSVAWSDGHASIYPYDMFPVISDSIKKETESCIPNI